MREVKYSKEVPLFFDKLFDVLIDKGYFSFYKASAEYLEDLVDFIEQNIENYPQKKLLKNSRNVAEIYARLIFLKKLTNNLVYFFRKVLIFISFAILPTIMLWVNIYKSIEIFTWSLR